MHTSRLKRAGKIVFVLAVIYVASFYFVFIDTFFWGYGAATSSDAEPSYKYVVGPTPSVFACPGKPDRGAANGTKRFTGKEWPFVVYRPLVGLYNHYQVPEVRRIDEEIAKSRKDFFR